MIKGIDAIRSDIEDMQHKFASIASELSAKLRELQASVNVKTFSDSDQRKINQLESCCDILGETAEELEFAITELEIVASL